MARRCRANHVLLKGGGVERVIRSDVQMIWVVKEGAGAGSGLFDTCLFVWPTREDDLPMGSVLNHH
jgi:hypothetical protein